MNYVKLASELSSDPLGRGYAGMTDAEAAASLNTADRDIKVTSITGAQLYNGVDATEFAALADADKQSVRDIWGLGGEIDVSNGTNAFSVLTGIFLGGSQTRSNLLALVQQTVSGAVELGFGPVTEGHVHHARNP